MPRRERTGILIDEPPRDPSRATVPAPRRAREQPLGLPAGRRPRRRNGPRLARGINELVVLVLLFVGYNVVRALPETTASVAVAHARHVLSLEGPLFAHLELPLNAWLDAVPPLTSTPTPPHPPLPRQPRRQTSTTSRSSERSPGTA
jgi:hypothetical protein